MKTQEINGLDVYEYEGTHFKMLMQYGTWGVAMSGGSQEFKPISRMTRHMMTDEVFVLLKGSCTLYTADQDESRARWISPSWSPTRSTMSPRRHGITAASPQTA